MVCILRTIAEYLFANEKTDKAMHNENIKETLFGNDEIKVVGTNGKNAMKMKN